LSRNKETIASIEAVYQELGNRVYKLDIIEGDLKEGYGDLTLDLSDHPSEYRMFYRVTDDFLVEVEVHRCPDLAERQTGINGLYYVWQRRFARLPISCPRCKNRLNAKSLDKEKVCKLVNCNK